MYICKHKNLPVQSTYFRYSSGDLVTTWSEVKDDPNFVKVLDHGFVGIVDYMGSDEAIARAARVSYGTGTKTIREDRGLIRYLMRHKHTSPFEMCEVKLMVKLPIFVMRQLVRHRTSSLNEYSARYSVLGDEMYIPNLDNIKPQSKANNQGRAGELVARDACRAQQIIRDTTAASYDAYQTLLGASNEWSNEFPEEGVARELARTVMPVAGYTELYWKQNVKNLLHMLRLRMDHHAQWEIQEFARAIYKLVQPLFPATFEAFEDYENQSTTVSRMERSLLLEILQGGSLADKIDEAGSAKEFAEARGMTLRELNEFIQTWKLDS